MQLGVVELLSKRYLVAQDHFEQAMAIAESIGDVANLATALANLGSATEMLGEFEESGRLLERSQKLYREVEMSPHRLPRLHARSPGPVNWRH